MMDLWIDFNSVTADGHATSLLQFAREGVELRVGQRITVGDAEGNTCQAEVVKIDSRGLVEVVLTEGTIALRQPVASAIA